MNQILILVLLAAKPAFANPYLPNDILNRIQILAQKSSGSKLCFDSAESSYGLGLVRNCVSQLRDGKQTLWLMKQDITTKRSAIHNQIGLLVDSSPKIPVAYFVELDRGLYDATSVLKPSAYKVPCLMCHASGPRLIRPSLESLKRLSEAEKELLRSWNQEIAADKIVNSYTPEKVEGGLKLPVAGGNEILKLPRCYQCHNRETGVRNELNRMHANTILFLAFHSAGELGKAQMPTFDSNPLSEDEASCLRQWLKGGQADGCVAIGAAPKSELKSEGQILVKVKTTFHDFEVKSLVAERSNSKEIRISLVPLATGIAVRDKHVHKLFETKTFPEIKIRALSLPVLGATVQVDAEVSIRDVTKQVWINLNCDITSSKCQLVPLTIDLEEWGFRMPSFLGISVDPKLLVSGTFYWNEPPLTPNL